MSSYPDSDCTLFAMGIDECTGFRLKAAALADPHFFVLEIDSDSFLTTLSGMNTGFLFLLPSDLLGDPSLAELKRAGYPLLAYGPAAALPAVFERGASDYLREPWGPEELLVRARRVMNSFGCLFGGGNLSLRGTILTGPGGSVTLTALECSLLRCLIRFSGSLVDRELLQFQTGLPNDSRALDVHVCHVRKKLMKVVPHWEAAGKTSGFNPLICSRGKGYGFFPLNSPIV
jgi:hypothetical protein